MKTMETAQILQNEELVPGIYDMTLAAPGIARQAVPGQFVEVYLDDGVHLLPRPISICTSGNGVLRLVYQTVGAGTVKMSQKWTGETLRLLGPLGNGYTMSEGATQVLVGGGVGTPPLLGLAWALPGKKEAYLGFRDRSILVAEFEQAGCTVHLATDTGAEGYHGNVVDLAAPALDGATVYACGPKPMLRALAGRCPGAQVSLEERMACGFGVCVGCVVKIQKAGEPAWAYRKVCKDGPVFLAGEVVWDA